MTSSPASSDFDHSIKFLRGLQRDCEMRKKIQRELFPMDDPKIRREYCFAAFDGWSCWNTTAAGETALAPCPSFVTGFDKRRFAFRKCLEDGTWFRHPDTGQPWSNYTTCIDMDDFEFRKIVNIIYVVGYSVSFAAIIISLIIFLTFRDEFCQTPDKPVVNKRVGPELYSIGRVNSLQKQSLRCTRIAIHVQLFSSFALNDLMWILWYKLVVGNTVVVQENRFMCQALHVLLQYLMVANYLWMFCEGLHLHLALVVVFVKDDSAIRWFYFIGWVLPAFLAGLYAAVRAHYPEDTSQCWMNESHTQWILTVPVLLSLLGSLGFLINVVRVLLTKLHCNSANPAPIGLRKAVRAALILVPLFGIHHILIPFRPDPGAPGERVYQVFSALLVSLQGFCVSLLFCFANVDVHAAFKAMARRIRRRATDNGNLTATQTREMV